MQKKMECGGYGVKYEEEEERGGYFVIRGKKIYITFSSFFFF